MTRYYQLNEGLRMNNGRRSFDVQDGDISLISDLQVWWVRYNHTKQFLDYEDGV